LKQSKLKLPKEFPVCFKNNNLCETVSSVLYWLENERHVIIVGENESGITQVARWCAEYFNKMKNKDNDKNENQDTKNKICLCLCTNKLECLDLIGQTKPFPKNEN